MSEYKGQHQVIIDGHELTPIQSNFVVEAIENQLDQSMSDLLSGDVDSIEKEEMGPGVLSLAEVIAQVNPEFLYADIAIDENGKALFTGKLQEFNPEFVDEPADMEVE